MKALRKVLPRATRTNVRNQPHRDAILRGKVTPNAVIVGRTSYRDDLLIGQFGSRHGLTFGVILRMKPSAATVAPRHSFGPQSRAGAFAPGRRSMPVTIRRILGSRRPIKVLRTIVVPDPVFVGGLHVGLRRRPMKGFANETVNKNMRGDAASHQLDPGVSIRASVAKNKSHSAWVVGGDHTLDATKVRNSVAWKANHGLPVFGGSLVHARV